MNRLDFLLTFHMDSLKLLGEYNKWKTDFDKEEFAMLYGSDISWKNNIDKYFPSSRFQNLDELTSTIRCMQWVHERCSYGDYLDYNGKLDTESIIQFTKNTKSSVNCLTHSIVFVQCMISLGIQARLVTCLQIDALPFDNHVVTEVFLPKMKKWILMDPTHCLYFTDESGHILNLIEFRERLIKGKEYKIIRKNRFANIEKSHVWNEEKYLRTLCYNLYVLEFYANNVGIYDRNTSIRLVPEFYHIGNLKKTNVTRNNQLILYTNRTMRIYQPPSV